MLGRGYWCVLVYIITILTTFYTTLHFRGAFFIFVLFLFFFGEEI